MNESRKNKPKTLSVNIPLPKEISFGGQKVTTAIFKEPVKNRVMLRMHNLDGGRQADLTVHRGADRAVYSYPIEHYGYWHNVFPCIKISNAMCGENFTLEDLMETKINVGDIFHVGSSKVISDIVRLYANDTEDIQTIERCSQN